MSDKIRCPKCNSEKINNTYSKSMRVLITWDDKYFEEDLATIPMYHICTECKLEWRQKW